MTVTDAAELLGMSKQTLRLWIISGKCPFGTAVKKYTRYTYYINETRLKVWINGEDIIKSVPQT